MRRGRTASYPTVSPRACAAAAALALYVATAARDVGGPGLDAAKFGYMSRILGVPHPPGYPLYMLAGWLWSWVPLGSLLFRMSVFSAVCGAATVWLLATLLERLGCVPWVAAAVAVLAATGRVFWSQSIIPEVYSLHTAFALATLVSLVAWKQSEKPIWLYAASLAFGLDLAHHTDVAVFAPAILVFLIVVNPRVFLSPRVVLTAAALVITPLALYAYVVIRTKQGAPYVEAGATTFAGLVDVISGRQFGYLLFRGGLLDAMRDRWRDLGRFFTQELGWWGCALALAGLVALWRRDWRSWLLVALGALGMLLFVLNYYPPDIEVFLLPVFLLCWVAIGLAVDAGLRRRRERFAVAGLLAIWIGWQVATNLAANNLRPLSFDARLFNRLFQEMPSDAAIIGDTIDVSQAILYKVFAEPLVAAKRPVLVVPGEFGATRVFGFVRNTPDRPVVIGEPAAIDRLVAERPAVYAFSRLADPLRAQGFRLDPVRLRDRPVSEYLASLDRNTIVAAALPASAAARLFEKGSPFAAIGAEVPLPGAGQCVVTVVSVGESRATSTSTGAIARVEIRKGQPVGAGRRPAPVDIVAECGRASASISVGGRELAASETGGPLVVLGDDGDIVDQTLAAPSMDYAVPFEWRWQPVYRVATPRHCVAVGTTLTDIMPAASQAGLAISLPPGARMTVFVESEGLLRVRAGQFTRRPAAFRVEPTTAPHAARASSSSARWTRVDVDPASSNESDVIDVVLGALPRAALASIDRGPNAASVCATTLGNFPVLAGALDDAERVMADGSREEIFGDGWEGVEQDEQGGFRWASAARAHVLAPMAIADDIRVSVRARRPPGTGAADAIGLVVNGRAYQPLLMADGWGTYAWTVGRDGWRPGVNDVAVESPRLTTPPGPTADSRQLGVAVRELTFRRIDPAGR